MSRVTARKDNLAISLLKADAENVLSQVVASGKLDSHRKIQVRGNRVEIPVTAPVPGFTTFLQELPEFYRRIPELCELLAEDATPQELSALPRGWYILGEIIIVKIPDRLERIKGRIGEALLVMYPRCKTVLRDRGIAGQLRQPVREIIAGHDTETIHMENGVSFKLDAMKIMFSQGNLRERMRMSRLGKGEFIVDMFAGIGYFSVSMAVHSRPKKVTAIELNPEAFGYLRENILLNRVEDIVEPILGDCRDMAPYGIADRVIMGFVGTTDRYLETGIGALRPGGVLHYHQTLPSWRFPKAAMDDVINAASLSGRRAEILQCIRVKKYSPGVLHAVVDARIDGDF